MSATNVKTQAANQDFEVGGNERMGSWRPTKTAEAPQRFVHHETGFAGGDFVQGNVSEELKSVRSDDRLKKIAEKADFISGTDSVAMNAVLKTKINAVAKDIWESYKEKVTEYGRAVARLKAKSEDDLAHPTPATKALLEKVEAGPPMTKQRALATAKSLVMSTLKRGA